MPHQHVLMRSVIKRTKGELITIQLLKTHKTGYKFSERTTCLFNRILLWAPAGHLVHKMITVAADEGENETNDCNLSFVPGELAGCRGAAG